MLSVQSPAQLAMTNDSLNDVHDDERSAWNAWRAPNILPTPPDSVPPRRLGTVKHHHHDHAQVYATDNSMTHTRAGQFDARDELTGHNGHHHLTLPPIAHLDRHWPSSSPLTPPDDEMHSEPLSLSIWRDAKPGPSRLHSPMTANPSPLLASPSPSPIDEDEQYDEQYDLMDEPVEEETEPINPEWEWEWQQQQQQREENVGGEEVSEHQQPHKHAHDANTYHANTLAAAADWVTNPAQRSAHFIAEKTCEMVCYLWFSSSLGPRAAAASRARRERELERSRRRAPSAHAGGRSPPFASRPLSNASTAALQFCASAEFVAFMAKLLATTQVSQSVIVLSLHYIFRLKERNDFTLGKPGSEFRAAVCALMLANKFVDDNTYTNKTWSDVSAIPLEELNKMEREFLLGVDFRLFVDAQTYESWLNLLKGLVLAKEREHGRWRERRRARVVVPPHARTLESREHHTEHRVHRHEEHQQQQRARSSSPHRSRNYAYAPAYPFTFAVPSSSTSHLQAVSQSQSTNTSPNRPVSKRTAADAFSPTSATFAGAARGGKRPTGLALDIRAALESGGSGRGGSVSAQPAYAYADSLRGLERMSLKTPAEGASTREDEREWDGEREQEREQTLAAPYRVADARRALPPHLYFYALASSPSGEAVPPVAQEERADVKTEEPYALGAERKARLRYVDSQTSVGEGYSYGAYGYTQMPSQNQSQAYGQQSVYDAPVSVHVPASEYPSSASSSAYSSDAYVQPQPQPHVQHHQHLPPLALALSMPSSSRTLPAQTQSACTSPLPSFAALDAYALPPAPVYTQSQMYTSPQAQGYPANTGPEPSTASYNHVPASQSAWSAPPSESVDGVYAPAQRHALPPLTNPHPHPYPHHPHHHQQEHIHLPAPVPYKSYTAAPTYSYISHHQPQQDVQQGVTATGISAGSYPERAAFANAGPPGVAHFYSQSRSGVPYNGASNASGNGGLAVTMPMQVSQSANGSPNASYAYGYEYARGRRY